MVKTTEDGTRIVEQILPFFTPEWTATVSIVPDMDITMDIPVVLTSVSHSDGYEGSVEQDRVITWDLTFTVKGYLFGPISKGGVITLSTTNVFGGLASADPAVTTDVYPGLLANGSPTTNASLTVDRSLISSNDNYDYVVTTTTNNI
jgi:hypothetical protein